MATALLLSWHPVLLYSSKRKMENKESPAMARGRQGWNLSFCYSDQEISLYGGILSKPQSSNIAGKVYSQGPGKKKNWRFHHSSCIPSILAQNQRHWSLRLDMAPSTMFELRGKGLHYPQPSWFLVDGAGPNHVRMSYVQSTTKGVLRWQRVSFVRLFFDFDWSVSQQLTRHLTGLISMKHK